jgi:hypothetical protein
MQQVVSISCAAHERRSGQLRGALERATGRDRPGWFHVLDAWGAPGRPYREIADWLVGHHGLSAWWAQKLIVEYEQARGLRPPGIRRDGTFEVSASKSVGVPVGQLFAAFADRRLRERWLPDAVLRERTARPDRLLRFDWGDGSSRVSVTFSILAAGRSEVSVEHRRLPDLETAGRLKTYWRERLAALKTLLERRGGGGRWT